MDHVLLDVRELVEFEICCIHGSFHVPLKEIPSRMNELKDRIFSNADNGEKQQLLPVVVICRRGNDSQIALRLLKSHGVEEVKDVRGGLNAWSLTVDHSLPFY